MEKYSTQAWAKCICKCVCIYVQLNKKIYICLKCICIYLFSSTYIYTCIIHCLYMYVFNFITYYQLPTTHLVLLLLLLPRLLLRLPALRCLIFFCHQQCLDACVGFTVCCRSLPQNKSAPRKKRTGCPTLITARTPNKRTSCPTMFTVHYSEHLFVHEKAGLHRRPSG